MSRSIVISMAISLEIRRMDRVMWGMNIMVMDRGKDPDKGRARDRAKDKEDKDRVDKVKVDREDRETILHRQGGPGQAMAKAMAEARVLLLLQGKAGTKTKVKAISTEEARVMPLLRGRQDKDRDTAIRANPRTRATLTSKRIKIKTSNN